MYLTMRTVPMGLRTLTGLRRRTISRKSSSVTSSSCSTVKIPIKMLEPAQPEEPHPQFFKHHGRRYLTVTDYYRDIKFTLLTYRNGCRSSQTQ
jgi:hypothetical protein